MALTYLWQLMTEGVIMANKIISFHSSKGGTGKSSLSSAYAYYLASSKGKHVLIIDADIGAPSLRHIVPGKDQKQSQDYTRPTWVDFLSESELAIDSITMESDLHPNLDVVHSPSPEVGVEFLVEKTKNWYGKAMRRLLKAKKEFNAYDYVVVDNENGMSYNSTNVLTFSDINIMVVRPVYYGILESINVVEKSYMSLQELGFREKGRDYLVWDQVPSRIIDGQEEWLEKVKGIIKHYNSVFEGLGMPVICEIPTMELINQVMVLEEPKVAMVSGLLEPYLEKMYARIAEV